MRTAWPSCLLCQEDKRQTDGDDGDQPHNGLGPVGRFRLHTSSQVRSICLEKICVKLPGLRMVTKSYQFSGLLFCESGLGSQDESSLRCDRTVASRPLDFARGPLTKRGEHCVLPLEGLAWNAELQQDVIEIFIILLCMHLLASQSTLCLRIGGEERRHWSLLEYPIPRD